MTQYNFFSQYNAKQYNSVHYNTIHNKKEKNKNNKKYYSVVNLKLKSPVCDKFTNW